MTTERTFWQGPKEGPPHLCEDPGGVTQINPGNRFHDSAVCAGLGGACAFTLLEPKGLTEEERERYEHWAANGVMRSDRDAGALILRLSAELAAAQAEAQQQRERAEKAEASADRFQRAFEVLGDAMQTIWKIAANEPNKADRILQEAEREKSKPQPDQPRCAKCGEPAHLSANLAGHTADGGRPFYHDDDLNYADSHPGEGRCQRKGKELASNAEAPSIGTIAAMAADKAKPIRQPCPGCGEDVEWHGDLLGFIYHRVIMAGASRSTTCPGSSKPQEPAPDLEWAKTFAENIMRGGGGVFTQEDVARAFLYLYDRYQREQKG